MSRHLWIEDGETVVSENLLLTDQEIPVWNEVLRADGVASVDALSGVRCAWVANVAIRAAAVVLARAPRTLDIPVFARHAELLAHESMDALANLCARYPLLYVRVSADGPR